MADEPEVETKAMPTQGGTFSGYKPQWKHDPTWGPAINKRLGYEGGEDWTDVPVTIIRGGCVVMFPDGRELSVGIPFPRICPGVLETLHMFGYEQAQALAWCWAASAQSQGATVEVRVKHYRLHYDLKAYAVIERTDAARDRQEAE